MNTPAGVSESFRRL